MRFSGKEPHDIAHRVHSVAQQVGALCSTKAVPAVGDWSQKGRWRLVQSLPEKVRLCKNCESAAARHENPLPARVERELALLAQWDTRAAALQRERLLKQYLDKKQRR